MDLLTGLTLAAPAGLNAYIPLLGVSLAQRFGWIKLGAPFDVMGSWWIIGLIVVLLTIELVADKVPVADHVNDLVQTVVRPVAGGLVALAANGDAWGHPLLLAAAGVLIAGSVHAVKATSRPVVNASTAGVGAPIASLIEDIGAVIMTILAFVAPLIVAVVIIVAVIVVLLLVRRLRRSRRETLARLDG